MRATPTLALAAWLALPLAAEEADAQVYVTPRRPGQTQIRYREADWRTLDLLVDAPFGEATAGGVRLYFDAKQEEAASRAAASVEATYREYVEAFGHVPSRRFPYVLYGTYTDFLRTNLFPVQEGVLGVTGTRSLELTLPYFGDYRRFEEVSRHELAHQFTIQKVRDLATRAGAPRDPLSQLPLWFVEGLAEFYAHGGMDPESEAVLRDMAANTAVLRYHGLPGFFDDYPGFVPWTYDIGQARITFLEEVYGPGVVQRVLDESVRLVPPAPARGRMPPPPESVPDPTLAIHDEPEAERALRFPELLAEIVGEDEEAIAVRFATWARRRAFPAWLEGSQEPADLRWGGPGEGERLNALAASPDGALVAWRSFDRGTGQARIKLTDATQPERVRRVATAERPGVESLHPVDARTLTVGADKIVFVAERRGADALWWRPVRREPLRLGRPERVDLDGAGLVSAHAPALSPDGTRVAFVGVSTTGRSDLWVANLEDGAVRRLTDDPEAEREVAWGHEGVVYTRESETTGFFELYRVRPGEGEPARVAAADADLAMPSHLSDGALLVLAETAGQVRAYQVEEGALTPLTDLPMPLGDLAPAPEGGAWLRVRHEGEERILGVERAQLTPRDVPALASPARGVPGRHELGDAEPYRANRAESWHFDNAFAVLGAGGGGVFGQAWFTASDRLRDHSLSAAAVFYGSALYADGFAQYTHNAGRNPWGVGAFQQLRFRIADTPLGLVQVIEPYRGGAASWRLPIDRFTHLQLDQSLGVSLVDPLAGGRGQRLQSESTLRLGADTIRYHPATGPIGGFSAMVEGIYGIQPLDDERWRALRLDAETYLPIPLLSGMNVQLRGGAGTSWGGPFARTWFLGSYDTLRAVPFGDTAWLLGRHYAFARAELQVPVGELIRVPFLSGVEGVLGVDAGGVGEQPPELWDKRVLDVATGANLALGPMVLRLHWARALDIGAPLPASRAPWVANVSLGWIGQ